jgi:hypothetical protein
LKSWEAPFVGTGALDALEQHVKGVISQRDAYAPYCSIVQSSGMGKSRLLHEFSRTQFVIPITLREQDSTGTYDRSFLPLWPVTPIFLGFPPPDNAIRNLLTPGGRGSIVYSRMLHFLSVLFEKTKSVIIEFKDAKSQSDRITRFRDFMTDGQTDEKVGANREFFYGDIARCVETVSRVYQLNFIFLHFTEDGGGNGSRYSGSCEIV